MRFSMVLLDGCAGHLTARSGGLRPRAVTKEVKVLARLRHEHLVEFFGFTKFTEQVRPQMVLWGAY